MLILTHEIKRLGCFVCRGIVNAPRGGNELVAARSQIVDKSRKQHRKLSLASSLAPPSCTTLIRNCGKETRIMPDVRKGRQFHSHVSNFSHLLLGTLEFLHFFCLFVAATIKAICAFSLNHSAQQVISWTSLGSNEGLRGKITTNRLSHGTAPNNEDLFTVTMLQLPPTSSRLDGTRSYKQNTGHDFRFQH